MKEFRRLDTRTVADLPLPCASCLFWELPPTSPVDASANRLDIKRNWVRSVTDAWGTPGWLAYQDGEVTGYLSYAPPLFVPRQAEFPTSPVSSDAIMLVTARVDERFARAGIGARLVRAAAKDALARHGRALEA